MADWTYMAFLLSYLPFHRGRLRGLGHTEVPCQPIWRSREDREIEGQGSG